MAAIAAALFYVSARNSPNGPPGATPEDRGAFGTATQPIERFRFDELHDQRDSSFDVHWPPQPPDSSRGKDSRPLLKGELQVSTGDKNDRSYLNFRIELVRSPSESARLHWNRQLAFPEYDWMAKVRVWDPGRKWLWPNVPYLLRAYGLEREDRYGGVDPGKGVDNDFAAVVIRTLSETNSSTTRVTAEWSPPGDEPVHKRSVVHRARSEDLQWEIPPNAIRGEVGVWLVYADFLGSKPPTTWPREGEFDGGILVYHGVIWRREADNRLRVEKIMQSIPPSSTGVDWVHWFQTTRRK